MILPLLLLSIVSVVLAEEGRSAQDCKIGDKWTEKYIRFECYKGTGQVVKGVRALGCVPTNTEKGAMIQPGLTFDEQLFTYSCSKNGDVVSYQIINCRDSSGNLLDVGQSSTMPDGSSWKCYRDGTGAIKLSQDAPGGCLDNGTKYEAGKTWIQNLEFKVKVGKVLKVIGKGVRMECKRAGAAFVARAMGCVTNAGATLYSGSYAIEKPLTIKCLIAEDGKVTMTVVNEKDVTCNFNKTVVKNLEKYNDGVNIYTCVYGIMKKGGCIINGKTFGADRLIMINKKAYFCNYGAGYVDFGDITGCPMGDGTVKPFYSTWINRTEVHRCYFRINGTVVTPFSAFWGCAFGKKAIGKYKIGVNGNEIKKCSLDGKVYKMRDLTATEHAAYLKGRSQGSASKIYGGASGSGSGEDLLAQVDPSKTEGLPPVDKPMPEINGKCNDLSEMCSDLVSICRAPTNSSKTNLEEVSKKANVTVEKIKEIFKLMGYGEILSASKGE